MKVYWYWPFTREENFPLAEEVRAKVHALTVSTIDRPGAWLTAGGVNVQRSLRTVDRTLPPSARWCWDRAAAYASRVRQRHIDVRLSQPDVAHLWYLNIFTDPVDLRRLARRWPTVLNVHDVWPHEQRLPRTITRAALQRIYEAPERLVVYHDRLAHALTEDFAVCGDRIRVIPLVVPPALGPVTRGPAHEGRLSILFFGTFRGNKGMPTLLRAIDEVRDDRVHWVIAGRGDPKLENAVRARASRDTVNAHIGWVDAPTKSVLFGKADLVVLPYSSFSSQSAVLHDAYAHGCPVVVTDVGALGSTVREDGTGWVIPADDPAALASVVMEAASNPVSRSLFSARALGIADERSPRRVAEDLVEIYQDVVS